MDRLGSMLWHVPTVMVAMLVGGLLMGQRLVGELSVFDLLTAIAIGAIAGAAIVEPTVPHGAGLIIILALALLHWLVSWVTMYWGWFARAVTFEPIVVIKDGKPLRSSMKRVRLAVGDLMPMLREKDVFDLREVEYAVFEPDGILTVLKRKPKQQAKGLPRPVIVDGKLQKDVLADLGWDRHRLDEALRKQGFRRVGDVFLATLDEGGDLYAAPMKDVTSPPVIHH